jgi:hypothetical protein
MIALREPNESWSKNQQKSDGLKDGPVTDRKLFFPPRRCGRIRSTGAAEGAMMEKRILIVGGVAAGASCAARARRLSETAQILD